MTDWGRPFFITCGSVGNISLVPIPPSGDDGDWTPPGNVAYYESTWNDDDKAELKEDACDQNGGGSQNVYDNFVTDLQHDLWIMGFRTPTADPVGEFGENTRKALKAFQRCAQTKLRATWNADGTRELTEADAITYGASTTGKIDPESITGELDAATRAEIKRWLHAGEAPDDVHTRSQRPSSGDVDSYTGWCAPPVPGTLEHIWHVSKDWEYGTGRVLWHGTSTNVDDHLPGWRWDPNQDSETLHCSSFTQFFTGVMYNLGEVPTGEEDDDGRPVTESKYCKYLNWGSGCETMTGNTERGSSGGWTNKEYLAEKGTNIWGDDDDALDVAKGLIKWKDWNKGGGHLIWLGEGDCPAHLSQIELDDILQWKTPSDPDDGSDPDKGFKSLQHALDNIDDLHEFNFVTKSTMKSSLKGKGKWEHHVVIWYVHNKASGNADDMCLYQLEAPYPGQTMRFRQKTTDDADNENCLYIAWGLEDPEEWFNWNMFAPGASETPPDPYANVGEPAGEVEINTEGASWSPEEARIGDEVTLTYEPPEGSIEDGTAWTFRIYEADAGLDGDFIAEVEGEASGGKVEAVWTWEPPNNQNEALDGDSLDGRFPEFVFVVSREGFQRRSGRLRLTNWFEIEVQDVDGEPLADESGTIHLPDGAEQDVTTDSEGKLSMEGLPFGPCRLEIPGLTLARVTDGGGGGEAEAEEAEPQV